MIHTPTSRDKKHSVSQRHWSAQYLGLPWHTANNRFQGYTCNGLRNLVYKEQLNISLPGYGDSVDSHERLEIQDVLRGDKTNNQWQEIRPEEAQTFDIVSYKLRGLDSHIGIVAIPGHMLHVTKGIHSRLESYVTDPWSSLKPRIYRYRERQDKLEGLVGASLGLKLVEGLNDVQFVHEIQPGTSVSEAIFQLFARADNVFLENVRVTIGFEVIERQYWHLVKPKKWDVVIIRVVPAALTDILRVVLSVAVIVVAAAVSGGALGIAGLGLSSTYLGAGSVSAAIAGAALAIGGTLLINALLPAKTNDSTQLQNYSINGFQNQADAGGTIGSLLGKMRFAPVFAALPYSIVIGTFRFANALFLIGYGPIEFSLDDVWIGNTPINNYIGIAMEQRLGYPDDLPITLYPTQCIEDGDNPMNVRADQPPPPVTRNTAQNITSCEIEIYFQAGLIAYSLKTGNQQGWTVQILLQYRAAGSDVWVSLGIWAIWNETSAGFYRVFELGFPERGQYEIMMVRLTEDTDTYGSPGVKTISEFSWTALRSFRPEYPLNYTKPMALLAVRILATAQLSGTISNLSVLGTRICPDWDVPTQSWITRPTQNPASLYRYVQQGPENVYPKTDDQLDLVDIQNWAEYCYSLTPKLQFNAYYNSDTSQDSVLEDVAGAGRALRHDRGDKYSIIVDTPRTTFVSAITPGNSSSFTFSNPKVDFPDAFIVAFVDETNSYGQASRTIPWYDFEGDVVITQQLTLPGKTNPDEIWVEARRKQYEAKLRQNSYSASVALEQLAYVRGDGLLVSHYVVNSIQNGGFVKWVNDDATVFRTDAMVRMTDGLQYQAKFRKVDSSNFVRNVVTVDGEWNQIQLSSMDDPSIGIPEVGDLVMFGEIDQATIECIVKSIEQNSDYTAQLTLIDSAPTLDALAAATDIPAWDGWFGNDVEFDFPTPSVPTITSVAVKDAASDFVTVDDPYPVVVNAQPSDVDSQIAESLQIQYRLAPVPPDTTEPDWILLDPFLSSVGYEVIPGFTLGDTVEIQIRAINNSKESAWSATTLADIPIIDTSVPQVSSASVTNAALVITISFKYPSDTFDHELIYRNSSNTLDGATLVETSTGGNGVAHTFTETVGSSGTYFYLIQTVLSDGTLGDPVVLSIAV